MTFSKSTFALSAILLLGTASGSFAATIAGGQNTEMKGGANKTETGMKKDSAMKPGSMTPKTNKSNAATTLGGKTKTD